MIYIKSWVKTLESNCTLLPWSYQSCFCSSSGTCYCVKINVVRKFVILMVLKGKLYLIPYAGTDKTSWNCSSKCPKKILSSIHNLTLLFNNFQIYFELHCPTSTYRLRNMRRRGKFSYYLFSLYRDICCRNWCLFFLRSFTPASNKHKSNNG